jgi:membrane protein YqaA with SNARE-associated domain
MSINEDNKAQSRFRDLLKISWIRTSIILGAILVAIGIIILLLMKAFNVSNTQFFSDTKAFVEQYGLAGIFLATILAGTLVPVGSPALVAAAALFGVPPLPLILVATTGFTIGMMVNYSLAYRLGRPYIVKKITSEKLDEITRLWDKWGWVLYTVFGLIPVLPVELLSFLCGLLKTRLDVFLILSFVPRLIIFAILAYFGEQAGIWMGIA